MNEWLIERTHGGSRRLCGFRRVVIVRVIDGGKRVLSQKTGGYKGVEY